MSASRSARGAPRSATPRVLPVGCSGRRPWRSKWRAHGRSRSSGHPALLSGSRSNRPWTQWDCVSTSSSRLPRSSQKRRSVVSGRRSRARVTRGCGRPSCSRRHAGSWTRCLRNWPRCCRAGAPSAFSPTTAAWNARSANAPTPSSRPPGMRCSWRRPRLKSASISATSISSCWSARLPERGPCCSVSGGPGGESAAPGCWPCPGRRSSRRPWRACWSRRETDA